MHPLTAPLFRERMEEQRWQRAGVQRPLLTRVNQAINMPRDGHRLPDTELVNE